MIAFLKIQRPLSSSTLWGISSVNIVLRSWVNAGKYWPVHFDMNEKIYKTFAKEGLNIPFPQMDVHVHKEK